jgi:hypothetical protein
MGEKEPFRTIYYGKSAKKPPSEAYIILGSSDNKNHSKQKKLTIALTQSRTEDRHITSVAPYQLGHKSKL